MIKQRILGRTGLPLSELCLGALNFGWTTDEKTAFAILDAYHAAGGNFIQATSHGPELLLPSTAATLAETIIGRWLRSRRAPREALFLATRIHLSLTGHMAESPLSRRLRDACEASLERLQTRYLDMVILEWNEGFAPIGGLLEAFDHVVRGGYARYIGAANFPAWRVADCLNQAYQENHCRMEALQSDYSLLSRTRFERETRAICREKRLGFLARSPLAGGFLARSREESGSRLNAIRRDWLLTRFGSAHGEAIQAAVAAVAARHEASSAQVALAWALRNPAVTSAVISAQSVAQLSELTHATSLRLSRDDLLQLDHATTGEERRLAPDGPPDQAARAFDNTGVRRAGACR